MGYLGVMHRVLLWLVEKRVVDFLLVLIKLSSVPLFFFFYLFLRRAHTSNQRTHHHKTLTGRI